MNDYASDLAGEKLLVETTYATYLIDTASKTFQRRVKKPGRRVDDWRAYDKQQLYSQDGALHLHVTGAGFAFDTGIVTSVEVTQ